MALTGSAGAPVVPLVGARRAAALAAAEALVARRGGGADLAAHGIQALAGDWTAAPLPLALRRARQAAATAAISAPALLERVRAGCDGRLVLIKGPAAAAAYASPLQRPYADVDLLVDDARTAQFQLLRAGFVEVGDAAMYEGIHHRRPLVWPGIALAIELHERPKWPAGQPSPALHELLDAARPEPWLPDGIDALPPAEHALVLAAHSWAHVPLRRLGDLVDIALVAAEADPAELDALARRWKLEGVWRTTRAACEALFAGGRTTLALRLWAGHLPPVRERTVAENHLQRVLSPFWALPPHRAAVAAARALAEEARPVGGESRGRKLRRSAVALRRAGWSRSRHDSELPA